MIKATSIVTILGVTLSSFSLASVPARAGNAGGVVAGGIIGFAAGAIVGSQLNKNKHGTYRRRGSGRSQEEREYWMSIQDALNQIGYNAGPVDGAPGRRTRQAIREFQMSIPDVPNGKLTPEQTQLLFDRAYPQENTATQPVNTPPQPGQGYANPAQPGAAQPSQGQTYPLVNQGTEPVQAQPVTTSTNPPAPAPAEPEAAPTANAQPDVQVDEQGRQFIEMNGQKFYLEQQ